ncbi:hypothetical protein FRC08_003969 [Ceratobasidium sp. 394]|nr:hypothetical protein FRC08_003969 [Ceratobasidium sp. 394]KAG9089437.1 hypothetical protein FS749_001342 [Ceratobasidium sp. UAMH 11750]
MPAPSKLIGEGATLLETTKRPGRDPSGSLADSPLDKITISDGFYRIVQYDDDDGTETNASFPLDAATASPSDSFAVGMSSTPQAAEQSWMFTCQYGVKYGHTIVPKNFPTDPRSGGLGATAVSDGMYVNVQNAESYPIWKVRCDESRTYRLKDGSTTTVYYFRIERAGRNEQVWRTETWNSGKPVDTNQATWDPILPNELFQLIPTGNPFTS